jgi:CheY-like chemotaxis protein/HPt (histidine-containing phosphotransfer) domain-containing protein
MMEKDQKGPATHIDPETSSPDSGNSRPSDCQIRVLVVDDNPLNVKLALAQLEQGGYEAAAVQSGEAALDALASTPYSLVLMDCGMPGMDGYTATREIRRREASERHTLVVGFSSNTAGASRAKCLEAGMDDYIARPVTASELATRLQRITGKRATAATPDNANEPSNGVRITATDTLDANVLLQLAILPGRDGSPLLVELKDIFLRNLPAMLDDLSGTADASSTELARAAHRLKSAATTIGGARLASQCQSVEDACGNKSSSSVGSLLTEVREEAQRLEQKLREIPVR